jgi:hypothetical protein
LTKYFVASGNSLRRRRPTRKEREMSDKVQFQTNIPIEIALK